MTRRGNSVRPSRNARTTREPDLGYYVIVTDAEATEQLYFEAIRNSLQDDLQDRLVIKVYQSATNDLIRRCLDESSKIPQYSVPCIVFDRDQVQNFDEIIYKADNNNIKVGWSNPCIEVWFEAYFGNMTYYGSSQDCCSGFAKKFSEKTGNVYKKSNPANYGLLCQHGDEDKAISFAENKMKEYRRQCKKPSECISSSTVYELVREIKYREQNSILLTR